MRRLSVVFLVIGFFFGGFLVGCVTETSMKDFDPQSLQSSDEAAIGEKIVSLLDAWERKDIKAILSHYTEDAQIMTGGGNPVIVSKSDYEKMIPERLEARGTSYQLLSRTAPKIKLLGSDKAQVKRKTKIRTKSGRVRTVDTKTIFVKINGEWLIKKSTFRDY